MVSATLNGVAIGDDQISAGRIQLTDLADDNVLIVESVQSETSAGEWVHRSVDPSDKEVYVWTSFEPDDARPRLGLLRPARPQGPARLHGGRTRCTGRS